MAEMDRQILLTSTVDHLAGAAALPALPLEHPSILLITAVNPTHTIQNLGWNHLRNHIPSFHGKLFSAFFTLTNMNPTHFPIPSHPRKSWWFLGTTGWWWWRTHRDHPRYRVHPNLQRQTWRCRQIGHGRSPAVWKIPKFWMVDWLGLPHGGCHVKNLRKTYLNITSTMVSGSWKKITKGKGINKVTYNGEIRVK